MSVNITNGTIAIGQRKIVVTRAGVLYACVFDTSVSGQVEIWKSSDNGVTWAIQDSSNEPASTGYEAPSIAIDNVGKIHVVWIGNATLIGASQGLWYNTFDTSNDTWGTAATIVGAALAGSTELNTSIAIDSNNKPHVAWCPYITQRGGNASILRYSTNVSGTWSNILISQIAATNSRKPTIAINKANIPEVVYLAGTDVRAAVGNQNDAGSFTVKSGLGTATSGIRPSIAIDPLSSSTSDTWVSWQDTSQFKVAKHKSGDSWATWQTASSPSGSSNFDHSLTINGGYRYLFIVNSTNDLVMFSNFGDTGSTSGVWSSSYTIESSSTFTTVIAGWATYDDYDQYVRVNLLLGDGTDVFYRDFMVDGQDIIS